MQTLITVVVSLALLAILSFSALSYVGDSFTKAGSSAESAKLLAQSEQVAAAVQLYMFDHAGVMPSSMNDLIGDYLKSEPAQVTWSFVEGGIATEDVSEDACLNYNSKVGVDSIPASDDSSIQSICYGDGSTTPFTVVKRVSGFSSAQGAVAEAAAFVTQFLISRGATVLSKDDGTVLITGQNDEGQLGVGNKTDVADFTPALGLPANAKLLDFEIADAGSTSMGFVLLDDGTVWAAGNAGTYFGFAVNDVLSFTQISSLSNIVKIESSQYKTSVFALSEDGTLYASGTNDSGKFGDPSLSSVVTSFTPVLTGVSDMALTSSGAIAVMQDGTVRVAGLNSNGSLGLGTSANTYTTWRSSGSFTDARRVEMFRDYPGGWNAVVLTNAGDVYGTGYNGNGVLGLGDTSIYGTWTQVSVSNVVEIGGGFTTYLLQDDGTLLAAGMYRGIGDGRSSGDQTTFIPSLTGVEQFSNKEQHNTARKTDGTYWFVGYNYLVMGSLVGTVASWTEITPP